MNYEIRPAEPADAGGMWEIFREVIKDGTTYVFDPSTGEKSAREYWFADGVRSFVASDRGWILGMYRLAPNQRDLGSHVANASFMVAPGQQGRGIGTALARHCLVEAKKSGFLAMQFNFVVSTNEAALALWKKLGFWIVGTLPKAFRHSTLGLVDAYVMYRFLDDVSS